MISTETPFAKFNLSPRLMKALADAEYINATPIQAATIPLGLERRDIIGCAQTGTGKTAAFLLPTIMFLEQNPNDIALILAPTREIVYQIADAARVLLKHHEDIRVAAIIGGSRMAHQLNALAKKPRLVVGTPGRLNDLLARRKLHLNTCHTLIFDEADRMLDMGFAPQIDMIVKQVPKMRQTVMFSATMAPAVEKLANAYLKEPKLVSVGQKETAPDALKQRVIITTLDKKETTLVEQLNGREGSILVFAETQRRVEKLGYKLRDMGMAAETIHGGRTQGQRFRALKNFKDGEVNILIATDVASRGLDIGNIAHVINYDLPSNPEDFLHRIGRTARNGKDGEAITLVMQAEYADFNRIKKYLKNCTTVGEFEKGAERIPSSSGRNRRGGNGGGGGGGRKFGGGGFKSARSGRAGGHGSSGGQGGGENRRRFGGLGSGRSGSSRPAFGSPSGGGNSRPSTGNRPSRNAY